MSGHGKYSEHRRLMALRACWTILSGGSVAWKLNITRSGAETAGDGPLFFGHCRVGGKPLTRWNIEFLHPVPQPDEPEP